MMAAAESSGSTPVIVARPGAWLVVSRPGYLDCRSRLPRGPGGNDTLRLEVGLYEDLPRTVEGRVLDAGSRTGCSPAVVSAGGVEVETGPDGSFLFAGFPAGPRELTAVCPGYETKTVPVLARAGETTLVNVFMRDTANEGAVDGRVFGAADRAGIGSARLVVDGLDIGAVSDSSGSYVIARVPAGEHRLVCTAPGFYPDTIPFRIVKGWAVTVDFALNRRQ